MLCILCHQPVDLLTLDAEGVGGMPAHDACARDYRAEVARVLADAEAMVMAERDPRRHRRGVRPAA